MGQFTGLLNELDTNATKPQPKAKANNTARRSPEKKAGTPEEATSKALATSRDKTNGKAPITAPMRGKRSHPDYTQAPAFIRKDTYKAVKIALLNDERGLDYSDLVEELLTAWLAKK